MIIKFCAALYQATPQLRYKSSNKSSNQSVADRRHILGSEDGFGVAVVLKFEEVMGGILEKEGAVFRELVGEAVFGGLVEGEMVGLGAIEQGFPIGGGREDETEVARVDAGLGGEGIGGEVGDELVVVEVEDEGDRGLAAQGAAEAVVVEGFGGFEVVDGEGEVEVGGHGMGGVERSGEFRGTGSLEELS